MTVERKISFKQCKCNLNGINHEEAIKYNNKEINRLRWSETFEIVRPAVIVLMEENISITKCMDMDTSALELLLKDFREISPIRRSSQLGLRKVHPDVLGNIKNKGAKRNPRELSKEKQRKLGFAMREPLARIPAVFAVKPQIMSEALSPLKNRLSEGTALLSIAAGIPVRSLQRYILGPESLLHAIHQSNR